MKNLQKYIVITTINPKSKSIVAFEKFNDWHIILVGDKKTAPIASTENITFLSLKKQFDLGFSTAHALPLNHYARKNIGYLYAIGNGADLIYETDDDNFPKDEWCFPDFKCNLNYSVNSQFINVYKYFSDDQVWPRGFPIDEIHQDVVCSIRKDKTRDIGVWQGLADVEPDVDSIYRLIINRKISFKKMPAISLDSNHYCPFNSQNTLWRRLLFPCLYLPSTVSFRFTDILRSYIAQRLMWEQNLNLGFTDATVYQERNYHNLMEDFKQEIQCFTQTKSIVSLLNNLSLSLDIYANLEKIYVALSDNGFINSQELNILNAWIYDCKSIKGANSSL